MIAKGIDEGATVRLPGLSLDGVDVLVRCRPFSLMYRNDMVIGAQEILAPFSSSSHSRTRGGRYRNCQRHALRPPRISDWRSRPRWNVSLAN
jgi:hypothetical protein